VVTLIDAKVGDKVEVRFGSNLYTGVYLRENPTNQEIYFKFKPDPNQNTSLSQDQTLLKSRIIRIISPLWQQAKVGDRVKVQLNNGTAEVGIYWSKPPFDDNNEFSTFTFKTESGQFKSYHNRRIIEILPNGENMDNKTANVPLGKFMDAVVNCDGATTLSRKTFSNSVLNGEFPKEIPGDKIVKAVREYRGGCEDAKKKFVEDLGLKWDNEDVEYEVTVRIKGTPNERFHLAGDRSALWRYMFGANDHDSGTVRQAMLNRIKGFNDGLSAINSVEVVNYKKVGD
jgi:hypothetical protein